MAVTTSDRLLRTICVSLPTFVLKPCTLGNRILRLFGAMPCQLVLERRCGAEGVCPGKQDGVGRLLWCGEWRWREVLRPLRQQSPEEALLCHLGFLGEDVVHYVSSPLTKATLEVSVLLRLALAALSVGVSPSATLSLFYFLIIHSTPHSRPPSRHPSRPPPGPPSPSVLVTAL